MARFCEAPYALLLLGASACEWSVAGAPCAATAPQCLQGYICCRGACQAACADDESGGTVPPADSTLPQAANATPSDAGLELAELSGSRPPDANPPEQPSSSSAGETSTDGAELAEPRFPCLDLPRPPCAEPRRLVAGQHHTCALLSRGSVECWGDSSLGQLGPGSPPGTLPYPVPLFDRTTAIAAGAHHACAVGSDGTVQCWGSADRGQLGPRADASFTGTPLLVPGLPPARDVVAGGAHSCALGTDANVYCWGANHAGQLGAGTTSDSTSPVRVALTEVVALAAGFEHTCAATSRGTVYCWGANRSGQLGNDDARQSTVPLEVELERAVLRVAAGPAHTCALLDDQSVQCWGANASGELGDGSTVSRSTPRPTVALGRPAIDIALGGSHEPNAGHTCAVLEGGAVSCWGANSSGQLGSEPSERESTPQTVAGLLAVQVVAGARHNCALERDERVLCWGENAENQLGDWIGALGPNSPPSHVYGIPDVDPLLERCSDIAYRDFFAEECTCTRTCEPLERCTFEQLTRVCEAAPLDFSFRWPCRELDADGLICVEDPFRDLCDEVSNGGVIAGDPSVIYDVVFRIAGVVQPSHCVGGAPVSEFAVAGGQTFDSESQKYYYLVTDADYSFLYLLNCRVNADVRAAPVAIDYQLTVPLRGGSSFDVGVLGECAGHTPNCLDLSAPVCEPASVPGYDLAPREQALFISALSATPRAPTDPETDVP